MLAAGWKVDSLAELRGFELPEDDSPNSHQLPEKGPTTLAAFTPIGRYFSQMDNAILRFESSQPSQPSVGEVQKTLLYTASFAAFT